jgi:hypothetical protein
VFLAVLLTSARYGTGVARLKIADLVAMTGLSERTVKGALLHLTSNGLLRREGRYGKFSVHLHGGSDAPVGLPGGPDTAAPPKPVPRDVGGADKLAPPRCRQACTSPTSIYVSFIKENSKVPFSTKQRAVIADVLTETTELLGSDALELTLLDADAVRLGLTPSITYQQALEAISTTRQARDFTRVVLHLRNDPRVQGEEL